MPIAVKSSGSSAHCVAVLLEVGFVLRRRRCLRLPVSAAESDWQFPIVETKNYSRESRDFLDAMLSKEPQNA